MNYMQSAELKIIKHLGEILYQVLALSTSAIQTQNEGISFDLAALIFSREVRGPWRMNAKKH